MELEGFGASLVGRNVFLIAEPDQVWIPWEYISGTQYTCKILVCGGTSNVRLIEAECAWNMVIRPQSPKEWSLLATMIQGMGGTILVVFDTGCPAPPPSFHSFMDSLVHSSRIVLTRIWVGHLHATIPEAIFFPVLRTSELQTNAYKVLEHMPQHLFPTPPAGDWSELVRATLESDVGIVATGVGETTWKLFWHKPLDSLPNSMAKTGLAYVKTGTLLLEKSSTIG